MNASRKTPIIVVLVVGSIVLGWCGYLVYRAATQIKTSTFRIVYKTMPAEDEAMTAWLRSQPGVKQATVSRDGDTLILVFVMAASSRDPEPEILPAGEKFGYGGWGGTATGTVLSPLFPWRDN